MGEEAMLLRRDWTWGLEADWEAMFAKRDCMLFEDCVGWFCDEEEADGDDILENRDCSSFIWEACGSLKPDEGEGAAVGEEVLPPMSKPGTFTPAWPSRFMAPWSGGGAWMASE